MPEWRWRSAPEFEENRPLAPEILAQTAIKKVAIYQSGMTAPTTAPVALTPVLTITAPVVTTASATATTAQPLHAATSSREIRKRVHMERRLPQRPVKKSVAQCSRAHKNMQRCRGASPAAPQWQHAFYAWRWMRPYWSPFLRGWRAERWSSKYGMNDITNQDHWWP